MVSVGADMTKDEKVNSHKWVMQMVGVSLDRISSDA